MADPPPAEENVVPDAPAEEHAAAPAEADAAADAAVAETPEQDGEDAAPVAAAETLTEPEREVMPAGDAEPAEPAEQREDAAADAETAGASEAPPAVMEDAQDADDQGSLGGGEEDFNVEFKAPARNVFRAAGGTDGDDGNGEDASLFIKSSAGPPQEQPPLVDAFPPPPAEPEPPAPAEPSAAPHPPFAAASTFSKTPHDPAFGGPLTGIGNPNIPDEDAPFGGLLPPANLTLIRKKPAGGASKPSKNYPEISGPSLAVLRAATAPPPRVAARRGRTARDIDEAARRAQRLSGELLGKNGRYVGNLRGGVPHGKGQLWLPTGPGRPERLAYEGDWHMGLQTGFGTLHFPNGEEYNGEVERGEMHGRGRYAYRNGDVFQGTWECGRRRGEGRLQYASGDIFVGTFEGAERRGFGVYYYVGKGCKLEGDWAGDKAVCGAVQNLSREEAELLRAPGEDWARAAIPPLRLAQPNRAVLETLLGARPQAARLGRELAAPELTRLRLGFARAARGEEPGKGVRRVDIRAVLRDCGVASSLAEGDLDALTAQLEGAAAAAGGRLELDAFLGVAAAFRAERPPVGLEGAAAEEELRAARRAEAVAAGAGGGAGGLAATGGKAMGGTVRAVSPAKLEPLRRAMRESMAYSARKA